VLVTHDPRLAEGYADRMVTLVDGAVATNKTALEAVI
jgi:ABC-type lipoprotein export system ATPase subunit